MSTIEHVELRTPIAPAAASAGQARAMIRSALATSGFDGLEDVACLLVTELVSNMVRHAPSEAELMVRREGPLLRVGVVDGDLKPPVRLFVSPLASGGRGLALVDALSDRWGYDVADDGMGKTVWFELCWRQGSPDGGRHPSWERGAQPVRTLARSPSRPRPT